MIYVKLTFIWKGLGDLCSNMLFLLEFAFLNLSNRSGMCNAGVTHRQNKIQVEKLWNLALN